MTKELSTTTLLDVPRTIVGTGGGPATNTHPWINGHGLELDPGDTPLNEIRSGLTRVYQVHFVPHSIFHYDLLRVNHLQTGLIGFQHVGQVEGSNPFWANHAGGLTISVDRPQGVPDGTTLGHFASVNLNGTLFDAPGGPFPKHGRFLVCGTFRRPVQLELNGFVDGDFAAAVLLQAGDRPRGATCQFKTAGSRLNLPGTGAMLNRIPSETMQDMLMNPTNPPTFTVILGYDRSRTPTGFAALFIDQQIVDSAPFDFAGLNGITKIDKILMGVGTATGTQYTAKIDLIDLQIWVPPHPGWW
jgi:hypothetical protein